MSSSQPKSGPSSRGKAIGGAILAGGALIVYYLLFGNPFGPKDFTGQDLRDQGDRFRGQDLVKAIFVDANVSGLDMVRAQLYEGNLERVIAERTDLYQANLAWSNLRNANLAGARLAEADFHNANLTGANLVGADIRGANFDSAILDGADLRDTRTGPSCLDRSTYVDHCPRQEGEDNCCQQLWNEAHIQGIKVCRNPWASFIRQIQDEVEGFGILGEPQYFEQNHSEGGMTYCTQVNWEGADESGWQDRSFDPGRGGLFQ
ncbi:MAG: pentapeptide repeat-containing protein [Bradymonadales bacterium]|nr:pentapeptide repeat-containing protein [Bradymonadales bacterium]